MNLQITNSENTTENNSGSDSQYNYTAPQLADNSYTVQRNNEYIAPLSPRPAGQLQETAQLNSESINDVRNEYLAIYNYIELKNADAVDNNPKTGTLTAWKEWGKGFFSGESSITDTPADVTLRDVATFSYNNISRFASESLSLSQRDR